MIDERYIELMNGEIDGVNSPAESRELRDYLEAHPEGRRHFEELKELGRVFAEADVVSPPSGLANAVLAAVAERDRVSPVGEYLDRLREFFRPAPRARFAYAFAAGVAAGFVIFIALSLTVPQVVPGNPSELMATLGIGGERCFPAADHVSFDVQGASGAAAVHYCAENVTVDLSLTAASEVVVVFTHDAEVDFEALRALQSGDHAVRVVGDRVELTHSGTRDYTILYSDYTESHLPMHMRVLAADEVLFESSVPPGRE